MHLYRFFYHAAACRTVGTIFEAQNVQTKLFPQRFLEYRMYDDDAMA